MEILWILTSGVGAIARTMHTKPDVFQSNGAQTNFLRDWHLGNGGKSHAAGRH
jgi:hypothetical protein